MLANNPAQIFVVTPDLIVDRLRVEFRNIKTISVLGTQRANKWLQMVAGLRKITSPVTVFADDDVLWPPTYLHYLLAAFQDPDCGAAGTSQRLV